MEWPNAKQSWVDAASRCSFCFALITFSSASQSSSELVGEPQLEMVTPDLVQKVRTAHKRLCEACGGPSWLSFSEAHLGPGLCWLERLFFTSAVAHHILLSHSLRLSRSELLLWVDDSLLLLRVHVSKASKRTQGRALRTPGSSVVLPLQRLQI